MEDVKTMYPKFNQTRMTSLSEQQSITNKLTTPRDTKMSHSCHAE